MRSNNQTLGATAQGQSVTGQAVQPAMMFVHSRLDEAGLSPAEFRVYGNLVRRANCGVAWPSIGNIAKVCRLHPQTVRKAIRELVFRNMVQIEPRAGETSRYLVTPVSLWSPIPRIDPLASNTPPSNAQGTPDKPMDGNPSETDAGKGNPKEGDQGKEIQSLADAREESVTHPSVISISLEKKAVAIFESYPRKAARKPALQAIQRALQKLGFDELLSRTRQLAQAWEGATAAELRFCPYPANWFRDERFNDDPQTWGPPPPAGAQQQRPSALSLKTVRPEEFTGTVGKL